MAAEHDSVLVSIVTPCYNMARYVEETVHSVLSQDYPYIEHIVMDGGSTDGSLEILDKYKDRITIYSGPDDGTADAVNEGIQRSKGSIVAFLNADDIYLPGAVSAAVRGLERYPEAAVVYGEALWVDGAGKMIGRYPTLPFDKRKLAEECFICQPASFIRRSDFEKVGGLDPALHFAFDYDLWIRMARRRPLRKIDEVLAASRMHHENKTLGSRTGVFREAMRLLKKHYDYVPFQWVHGYCSYFLDRRDQFFEPLRPSFLKYLVSLPVGLWVNRRHPVRYGKEWKAIMTKEGFQRRLNESWMRRAFQSRGK